MKLHENIARFFRSRGESGESFIPFGIISGDEILELKRSYGIYLDSHGISLAASISKELATLSVTEFDIEPKNGKGKIISCIDALKNKLKKAVEYACAIGGIIFKPTYDGKDLGVETVLPFDFIPLGTDASGRIDECAFIYRVERNGKLYTRIEEHRRSDDGYVITNRVFEGENATAPSLLSYVAEWASISPRVEIKGLSKPLFVYFGMPFGNPTHPFSPFGVPVFRRAENLIHEADKQFERLLWEFEGGELAVDASDEAFRIGKDGKPVLPLGKERLFRTNALDACCSSNELFKIFAPELRDKSLINGLNRIIMLIEDACGIARGTFSDPSEIAKTATEVRSMRQRTYTTVLAIRTALKDALNELFNALTTLCSLYSLNIGKPSLGIMIGDGIIDVNDNVKEAWREDVKCGIITADEYKARWYK
ncbi:MAG: hypothetical protein IJ404_02165 [Clostridia bacterium]|nr:hypothetical protein [Clostridia bacterium]